MTYTASAVWYTQRQTTRDAYLAAACRPQLQVPAVPAVRSCTIVAAASVAQHAHTNIPQYTVVSALTVTDIFDIQRLSVLCNGSATCSAA
eukprot:2044-Heterococcus_DN1.PRE.3